MSKERSKKPLLLCMVGEKRNGRSMSTKRFIELSQKYPSLTLEQIFDKARIETKEKNK